MKANKWVAVLATGLVLAVAAPVSAQFDGFKSLKKAMDTVAKELEQPKPTPQPQPTARPTPPQSRPATSQGGYASSAPQPRQRTEQVQTPIPYQPSALRTQQLPAPATPVVRQVAVSEVVATEEWRCLEDGLSSKLTLEYFRDTAGRRIGNFTESNEYDGKQSINKGRFRSDGVNYRLRYENSDLGDQSLSINVLSAEDGYVSPKIRYANDDMRDISTLILEMPENSSDEYEENGGGSNGKMCDLVKPIYSKYSFEDFVIEPANAFERYRETPVVPKFSKSEKELRNVQNILEAAENKFPEFAKYYIIGWNGDGYDRDLVWIDARTGNFSAGFLMQNDEIGIENGSIYNVNSKLHISMSDNDLNDSCFLNYSVWTGDSLKILESDRLGARDLCRSETQGENGSYVKEGLSQLIEDQIIRGERTVPAKTPPPALEGTPPTNPSVSAKTIRRLGSDYPSNIQITSGRTPTLIQNSLRTITSCTLGYSESEQDTPLIGKNWITYSFEMGYDPATTSVVFREFESIKEGQADFSKSTFYEAFQNVGVTDDIKNINIAYIGYDEENYYFRFNLVGNQNAYEINSSVIKEWMESSPLINAKFSNNWELNCDNPENNG